MKNNLATTHPHLLIEWDYERNLISPEEITYGSGVKVHWKCEKGKWLDGTPANDHEWEMSPNKRTSGIGQNCPCCVGKKVVPSNCLATTHPHLLIEWDYERNIISPQEITYGSNEKVHWKCEKGKWPDGTPANDHEWEMSPNTRISGVGQFCPCCSGKKVVPSNCLATTHPHLLIEWDYERNIIYPEEVTYGSAIKAHWICRNGKWPDGTPADDHMWTASIHKRSTYERNCPCCVGKKVVPSNCLATTHPHLLIEWDYERNIISPQEITYGSTKIKIYWRCSAVSSHIWAIEPNKRTSRNTNCPICRESQGERRIAEILTKFKIKFERQFKFENCKFKNPLSFDFKVGNYLIEFQGGQHYFCTNFGRRKTQEEMEKDLFLNKQRDEIKRKYCENNGFKLIIIPYWEFKNIEQIIINSIINSNKTNEIPLPSETDLLPFTNDLEAAAKKFNKTTMTIRRWMKHYGIYEPKPNYGPGKITKEKADEIRRLDGLGMTQSKIGEKLGLSQTAVGKTINKAIDLKMSGKAGVAVDPFTST